MMSKHVHEEEPFLVDSDDGPRGLPSQVASRPPLWIYILHLLLIACYTSIFIIVSKHTCSNSPTSVHPIANVDMVYIPKAYTDFTESPYAGDPGPQLEEAWHDLLQGMAIRVSHEELRASNQTSVALPKGGHMVWMGAYHELHCIKTLRKWNYRDHYHRNMTEDEEWSGKVHADHCLDLLRSAAMCHADTTLTTFNWAQDSKPTLDVKPVAHRCVDWDMLMMSVKERVVEKDELQAMENPNMKRTLEA